MKFTAIAVCICFVLEVQSQAHSVFSLMRSDSITNIWLSLDWKELQKTKEAKEYLPAKIRFKPQTGDSITMNVKVRARGHMRLDICYFPPLKLKFAKEDLSLFSLSEHNELDLVHHCQPGEQYEQLILKEFLAYKLYQIVSPVSYQVHLVRVHYLNKDGTTAHPPTIGFVVEHSEELVSRVEGKCIKAPSISQHSVDQEWMLKVALFQYMIGNTDWFVRTRHNLEFIVLPGYSLMVTIPYDFDYSGLVSAPYATHHESIKLPIVLLRYYQGRCAPADTVMKVVNEFVLKKHEFLAMPSMIYGLNERSARFTRDYLQDFFSILEDPKKLDFHILRHCDRWPVPGEN